MPLVVKNLIIINALFFLAKYTFDQSMIDSLGLFYFKSNEFKPYQLFTYFFMHGSFSHIFFNMFAVWMFGSQIEKLWGTKRFINYYLITAIGAALIHYLIIHLKVIMLEPVLNYSQINWVLNEGRSVLLENKNFTGNLGELNILYNVPVVGASGAVLGLLLAYGMTYPNQIIYLNLLFPIKAKYFVIIYGLIEFYMGIQNNAGDNVAHFAHLGGMLFGFLLIKYWKKNDMNFY